MNYDHAVLPGFLLYRLVVRRHGVYMNGIDVR